jgi:hypothetical protein
MVDLWFRNYLAEPLLIYPGLSLEELGTNEIKFLKKLY